MGLAFLIRDDKKSHKERGSRLALFRGGGGESESKNYFPVGIVISQPTEHAVTLLTWRTTKYTQVR